MFEHQGYHLQDMHRIYVFVALDYQKNLTLILDTPLPPDCDNSASYKLNDFFH